MRERWAVCHEGSLATTRGNAVPTKHSAQEGRESPACLAASGGGSRRHSSRLAPRRRQWGSDQWRHHWQLLGPMADNGSSQPAAGLQSRSLRRHWSEPNGRRFIDIVVRHGEQAQVDLTLLAAADAISCCPRSAWPRTHGGQASLSYIPRSGTPPKTRNACQWASNIEAIVAPSVRARWLRSWVCSG